MNAQTFKFYGVRRPRYPMNAKYCRKNYEDILWYRQFTKTGIYPEAFRKHVRYCACGISVVPIYVPLIAGIALRSRISPSTPLMVKQLSRIWGVLDCDEQSIRRFHGSESPGEQDCKLWVAQNCPSDISIAVLRTHPAHVSLAGSTPESSETVIDHVQLAQAWNFVEAHERPLEAVNDGPHVLFIRIQLPMDWQLIQ